MTEILVRALRDEHQDREWVDAYGYHWAWCEDSWVWKLSPEEAAGQPFYPNNWIHPIYSEWVNERREGKNYGPGPFMEALHHRAIYGRNWP